MAELKPYKGEYFLWKYVPSRIAGSVFVALFILATLLVLFRMIKTRTLFSIPFILGGGLEIVGYAARAIAHNNTDKLLPFALQQIFILVAPALFAASVYMTMGRLVRSVKGEKLSIISVRWLTRIFVLGDVFSFLVQLAGGGMATKEDIDPKLAERVIVAGLFIQIIVFGLYAVTAIIFQARMKKHPEAAAADLNPTWRRTMAMMHAVSVLIMVRSVFRVIEYIMGGNSYLLKNEWTLYVFDGALMFLTMAVYAWYYPGNLRMKKGGEWNTVESAPGTSSGGAVEMKSPRLPHHHGQF